MCRVTSKLITQIELLDHLSPYENSKLLNLFIRVESKKMIWEKSVFLTQESTYEIIVRVKDLPCIDLKKYGKLQISHNSTIHFRP